MGVKIWCSRPRDVSINPRRSDKVSPEWDAVRRELYSSIGAEDSTEADTEGGPPRSPWRLAASLAWVVPSGAE